MFLALLLGGGFIAWVGWIDDKRGVAAKWRLIVQTIAAIFALFLLKEVPELPYSEVFLYLIIWRMLWLLLPLSGQPIYSTSWMALMG